MPLEIEHKFLVKGEYKPFAVGSFPVTQGYLSSVSGRTVRVRIKGDKGFLTIKGATHKNGLSRYEWEKEIDVCDARELLQLCEPGIIDKTRHLVPVGKHVYEVDEFHGENQGLVIAELELSSEDESFEKPPWLGEDVSLDHRYHNSMLSKNPFSRWTD